MDMADWYEAQIDRLGEAVERVRDLHKPFTYVWGGEIRNSGLCVECEDQEYPCDTIKALDGELNG